MVARRVWCPPGKPLLETIMTAREAIAEALRMNGLTETQIKERMIASDLAFPGIATSFPVKPGMEKEFIAGMAILFRRMDEDPKFEAEMRAIVIRERDRLANIN